MLNTKKVIMIGATGAVGNQVALTLSTMPEVKQLTLLGRRPAENIVGSSITQHEVDIFSPASYEGLLEGHTTAICTLGVGQPSKMTKAEFVKIDKDAVLSFASACKKAGVTHFELLSSVGVSSSSKSFFLRTKGELEDGLKALEFERLSQFHPSMIITPTNRYGLSQALVLKIMPWIDPLLIGSLSKYRSILVEKLGRAMAMNVLKNTGSRGTETLHWVDFIKLSDHQH